MSEAESGTTDRGETELEALATALNEIAISSDVIRGRVEAVNNRLSPTPPPDNAKGEKTVEEVCAGTIAQIRKSIVTIEAAHKYTFNELNRLDNLV